MGTEAHRAQREAVADVERDAGEPQTSTDRVRDRALLRYLSAEFKRVTARTSPEPKQRRPK